MRILNNVLTTMVAAVFFASCTTGAEIVYDLPFEQLAADAQSKRVDFCVVLSRPDCPPCASYIDKLSNRPDRRLIGGTIYNIVDVMRPENNFYTQWLCSGSFPTTCVFSSDGKLKAVVSGASRAAVECIESARDGNAKCADYFYSRRYPISHDYVAVLNELLECKLRFDNGEDISKALDNVLSKTDYPYPVYLKALNEDKHGRRDEAVRLAERLLSFDEAHYFYVYSDLFTRAKYIINPNYTPQDDGMLAMEDEITLDDCKVGEPRQVTIHVDNPGKFPAIIRDIQTSCTCLKLLSQKQHKLEPGGSVDIEVEFTGENKGEFYREVMFFSDSSEPLKRIALRARVA